MRRLLLTAACVAVAIPLSAQWTNRYQRIGQGHHVYVEGYDFPTYSAGPTYPAASPDGKTVAFSARGWIWLMPADGGPARRVTKGAGLDSRPAWHPDSTRLAFVRDTTTNTDIVELDLSTGVEILINGSPAAELDPAYAPDGASLYYASAETGDLELYQLDLDKGVKTRLTNARGLDLRPQPLADGSVVFVSKRGSGDEVAVIDAKGERRVLALASVASLARPAVSPDGRRVVVPLPVLSGTQWSLQLVDVAGGPLTEILSEGGHPITPSWSADGGIYFSRADDAGVFHLMKIDAVGGAPRAIAPTAWDWGEPTARVRVSTTAKGKTVPARVSLVDRDGHPAFAAGHQTWLDGQNGDIYGYSGGAIEFEIPAGSYGVKAARGFEFAPATSKGTASAGVTTSADLPLTRVAFDMTGWHGGDHHFHLNYGGQALLKPDALVPMMRGEDLDVATPLSANLHTRRIDEGYFNWTSTPNGDGPIIRFGQEVRSHFLGHTGHIGVRTLFWPWYWGPGYPIYGRDDRSNVSALRATRAQGGVSSYVHPVTPRDPFGGDAPRGIPLELVADAVLGDVDTIELACLWSDELGTSEAWYRLLNVGSTIAPSAGTDAMVDFFRTMAIGTTRVYVNVPGELTLARYLDGLKAGRSFVTSGPLLKFEAAGTGPGGAVTVAAAADVAWTLNVGTAVPFERVEIIVNGTVAWTGDGLTSPGSHTYRGSVKAPAGGWIAARVYGGDTVWPAMDSYPFAHTAPIWFGAPGSVDPTAAASAARDLLAALDVAEARIRQSYSGSETPVLLGRIEQARTKLQAMTR